MMSHFANGRTGTIGRHLDSSTVEISLKLENLNLPNNLRCIIKGARFTHLAGIVGESQVQKNPQRSNLINVIGTIHLAEFLIESGIERFTFISTSHVYGPSKKKIAEDWELNPRGLYASQKLETEIALKKLFSGSGVELTILRVFSILDWDVKEFTLGGSINKIAQGDLGAIIKNTDDVRDFLTPVRAAKIIERVASMQGMQGTWNICTGQERTIKSAGLDMLKNSRFNLKDAQFESGHSDIPYLVGNNKKILQKIDPGLFQWQPSNIIELNKKNEKL